MEEIGRSQQGDDPLCRSGMMQGTRTSERRKTRYGTENPEGTDVQDKTMEGTQAQGSRCILRSRGHQIGCTGRL
jgi:hypothetical protein